MEPAEELEINFVEDNVHEAQFGGYDFVFVDELSPGQTCSICLVAMRNPVQTTCGHRFCEDCLVGTFRQGNDPACPQDRNPIPEDGGFFRDIAWEREILSLRVKCKKNERGCEWIGQLRHYEEHFDQCRFEDLTCDDCDGEMQRRFLYTHLESECPNRIVQCSYCEENFEYWRTEVHEDVECTRFPLECPQQCGVQEIPREEMESHVKVHCLMTVVVCPYEGAGCTFQDKRVNLKDHIEESSEDHLSKTWSELLKTKQELTVVKEMEGHVEEIQSRVKTLQLEKEVMETSLQRNSKEISELKLSEKKLEVENMSLRQEVTELGRQLAEVKTTATTENRSLKELVQTMQRRLEAIAKDGLTQEQDELPPGENQTEMWYKKQSPQPSSSSSKKLPPGENQTENWYKKQSPQQSSSSKKLPPGENQTEKWYKKQSPQQSSSSKKLPPGGYQSGMWYTKQSPQQSSSSNKLPPGGYQSGMRYTKQSPQQSSSSNKLPPGGYQSGMW